jgi:hypothetical protein
VKNVKASFEKRKSSAAFERRVPVAQEKLKLNVRNLRANLETAAEWQQRQKTSDEAAW